MNIVYAQSNLLASTQMLAGTVMWGYGAWWVPGAGEDFCLRHGWEWTEEVEQYEHLFPRGGRATLRISHNAANVDLTCEDGDHQRRENRQFTTDDALQQVDAFMSASLEGLAPELQSHN